MDLTVENLATRIPLNLDLAGIFFQDARERFEAGFTFLAELNKELNFHYTRVTEADGQKVEDDREDAWGNVIQGLADLEPICGKSIGQFAVAQILLVASAEAYVNAIAKHMLGKGSATHFDKLSPTGKWLFLPKVLGISWSPSLSERPLQDFADLVRRRNLLVHPREVRIQGIVDLEAFLKRLGVDSKIASRDIDCVTDMIRQFSLSWKGSYGPDWLDANLARRRPPCFFGGNVEVMMRFGEEPKTVGEPKRSKRTRKSRGE